MLKQIVALVASVLLWATPTFESLALDPADYATGFFVQNNETFMSIQFPVEKTHWQKFLDSELYSSADGSVLDGSWQHRQFDNLDVWMRPFGFTAGLGYYILDIRDLTESFTINMASEFSMQWDDTLTEDLEYVVTLDVDGVVSSDSIGGYNYIWEQSFELLRGTIGPLSAPDIVTQRIENTVNIEKNGAEGLLFTVVFEFNGIDDEQDTTRINYTFSNHQFGMDVSVSDLYYQNQQNGTTSKLLQEVNDQLADMGTTMEEVLAAEQANGEKLDQILSGTNDQQQAANDAKDELGGYADSVTNNSDKLQELTPATPAVGTDLMIDETYLASVTPILANIWSLNGMSAMLAIVFVVATMAYVFFGKRDS